VLCCKLRSCSFVRIWRDYGARKLADEEGPLSLLMADTVLGGVMGQSGIVVPDDCTVMHQFAQSQHTCCPSRWPPFGSVRLETTIYGSMFTLKLHSCD
jgi:hypothetical protein